MLIVSISLMVCSTRASYDHELKIQKAMENARRTEKQKEVERYELLLHDFMVSCSSLDNHRTRAANEWYP